MNKMVNVEGACMIIFVSLSNVGLNHHHNNIINKHTMHSGYAILHRPESFKMCRLADMSLSHGACVGLDC